MINDISLSLCPLCAGNGTTGNPGAALTCTNCGGKGAWVETNDGKKLAFIFPAIESPRAVQNSRLKGVARHAAYTGSLVITLGSFLYLCSQYGLSGSLFWHKGLANAVFGLSGLTSIWSIASLHSKQTSQSSLHEINEHLGFISQGSELSLNAYANPRVEQLLKISAQAAQELRSEEVTDTVLLITLLRQPRIQGIFARTEQSTDQLIKALKDSMQIPHEDAVRAVTYSKDVRQRLYEATVQAVEHNFPYIDLEDILLSYLARPGIFEELFGTLSLTYDEFYAVSRWYAADQEQSRRWAFWLEKGRTRPRGYMNRAWTALPTPFLDRFSIDLTRVAAQGAVATASVRDAEMQRMLEILGRSKKNSLLLLGEPGVGKNTLIEALALRMVQEEVPEILKDKRLVCLDSSALLGNGATGEENMQQILNEVGQAGNVILAIPDVQVLVGGSGTALDAASLLSSALDKGYLQVVTTATYADFHRYVESNPQLTAILETVEVKEVNVQQAISILEEESPQIESRQKVWLSYPALAAAATLSKKYFPEKMLPESAIGLLDEAASSVRLGKGSLVTEDDIMSIVEKKTNIPVRGADQAEADRLLGLEDTLHRRIVGQEQAVHAIASAVRRSRAGLHAGNRPISSFLFVGPTGVGKTETAKALAASYFGNENSMIRLDMSEYQDATSINRLIGAPQASSDSHAEGGSLTQPVREHPFSLILLDELEKATPEVLNLFLQLLDDGRLTENTGRTVHFNNTIIIATSNAGSSELAELMKQGLSLDELPKQTRQLLQAYFKPEFLNRFDDIVAFHPLTQAETEQIVSIMLAEVSAKMAEQQYQVQFTPETVTKIATTGFDPLYGARPIRRLIQDKVEGRIAELILQKALIPGQPLRITPEMVE